MLLIKRKKMSKLEQAYAMKQEVQQPIKLMDYFFSNRSLLIVRYDRFSG